MHTARVVCRTVHPRPTLGHQNIITRPAYLLHPLVLFNVSIRKALEILSDTSLLVTPTIRGHFMVFESYRRIIQFFSQVLTHERWWRARRSVESQDGSDRGPRRHPGKVVSVESATPLNPNRLSSAEPGNALCLCASEMRIATRCYRGSWMIIPAYVATLGGIWPKEPESSVPVCVRLCKSAP
jgi:hypothetical protein